MKKLRLPLILAALALLALGFGTQTWLGSGGPGSDGPRFIERAWAAPAPPVADAGPDLTAPVSATVVLDATGTTDPKDRALQSFTWTVVSLPPGSLASLDDSSLIKPSFLVDQPGDYVFELVVVQGNRTSDPDQVTISTVNSAPVADAGRDRRVGLSDTVTLDGSGSTVRDGDPLTYSWSIASAPAGSSSLLSDTTAVRPTLFIDQDGDYLIELTVDDGTVASLTHAVALTTDGNLAPITDAGRSLPATVSETITLQPGMVGDTDGDDAALDWSLIARPAGSSASLSSSNSIRPSVTIDLAGTYIVQLVADDGPLEAVETMAIDTDNNPPVANAGPEQVGGVSTVITLDAAASSDAEGDGVTYRWELISQPAASTATLDDPAALRPTFTIDVAGVYVAQLIVYDGTEEGLPSTVAIDSANGAPSADAGPDQAVSANDTVQLDAVGSSDPDSDPLTYLWTMHEKPNGPGGVLSDPTAQNPTFLAKKAGDYLIGLIVTDGNFESAPDTILVSTNNIAPVANAGGDQSLLGPGVVQLDGAGSSDANSDPLTYRWALIHVPAGSTATLSDPAIVNPTITVDVMGDYVAQLVVSDGSQASDPDTVVLTLGNSPPVANAGPDRNVIAGTVVQLDGTASSDPDEDPITYAWSLTAKPTGSTAILSNPTTATPSFTADLDGVYVAELIVNDGEVDSDPDTVTITAVPNIPPVANAGPDQNVTAPSLVQLNGNSSSDPNFQPITFAWSILSVPAGSAAALDDSTAAMPTFTADLVGTYDIQLIVNDGLVNSPPDTVTITAAAPNGLPVLAAIGNQSVDLGTTLNLQLAATDPDLDPITFLAVPLPLPDGASLDGMTGAFTFQPNASQVGNIDLTFLASDGTASDSEAITITVVGAQPGGVTAISGRLLDANDAANSITTPVVGAVIGFEGFGPTATSDINGDFTLSNLPSGEQILKIDSTNATDAPDGSRYGNFIEKFVLIASVTNMVERPIYLPRIDSSSGGTVAAGSPTTVTNATLGVSMTIAADTAENENGTAFEGVVYISEVPTEFAPVELPEDLDPNLLLSIQSTATDKFGNIIPVNFTQPVPISFPNNDGLVAGSLVDLYSLDAATGTFIKVGVGQVNGAGTMIDTISGGISTTTWHLAIPPFVSPMSSPNPNVPGGPMCPLVGSTASLCTGGLYMVHGLPAYRSFDRMRGLKFYYNSTSADPQPIVTGAPTIPASQGLPPRISTRLFLGGVQMTEELYTSTAGLNENVDETFHIAVQFDAKDLVTGSYPIDLALTSVFGSLARTTGRSNQSTVLVNNEIESPFGAGWTLAGLQRIHIQNTELALTDGTGRIMQFESNNIGEGSFTSGAAFGGSISAGAHAVADLDNDGDLDIAVPDDTTGNISVLLNDGSGAYPTRRNFASGNAGSFNVVAVAVGDFNEDNLADLAVLHRNQNRVMIHFGTGAGFFAPGPILTYGTPPISVGVGDFNNDGNAGVAVMRLNSLTGNLSTHNGDGNGNFTVGGGVGSSLSRDPISVHVADIRGDTRDDVLLAIANSNNRIGLHTADNSGGNFSLSVIGGIGTVQFELRHWLVESADFDDNGIQDVVIANDANTVTVVLGDTGATTWGTPTAYQLAFVPNSIDIGDFNGDGIEDIVAVSRGNIASLGSPGFGILLGDGAGAFGTATVFPSAAAEAVIVGDVDEDGLQDVVLATNPVTVHYGSPALTTVFESPPGDFSTLVRNSDGTFTRTSKRGIVSEFDATGLMTAVIDRNGNTTSYAYDAQDRLETITDPANLVTTLVYGGDGKLDTVTDPAGRVTTFVHDGTGDLTCIIDADLTERDFAYDARHRVISQDSKRDFTTTYEYGSHGRFVQSNRPDNATRKLVPVKVVGVVDTSQGFGSFGNPAPLTRPADVVSFFTDGRNNSKTNTLDLLGNSTSLTDAIGRVTSITRDSDGLPLSRTFAFGTPDASTVSMIFDDMGNMLTSTFESIAATTTFTYDPVFNLVTSVSDANGNPPMTTIRDGNGNAIETIDAAGTRTTIDYSDPACPGLATVTTVAVSLPEEAISSVPMTPVPVI